MSQAAPPPLPPLPPRKTNHFPDAQWLCSFLIGFSGYLFASRPTTVPTAIIFRGSLMLAGIIGLILIAMRKKKTE